MLDHVSLSHHLCTLKLSFCIADFCACTVMREHHISLAFGLPQSPVFLTRPPRLPFQLCRLRDHRLARLVEKRTSRQPIMSSPSSPPHPLPTHLSASLAAEVDRRLMDPSGTSYSLEQLMELAGLACAEAICDFVASKNLSFATTSVAVVCGPGNNGGDGLVAARHLVLFGFAASNVSVICPVTKFDALTKQLSAFGVAVREDLPEKTAVDVVVDAVFGFSFRGPPVKAPFDALVRGMRTAGKLVVSIDMPSGWDVNEGDIYPEVGAPCPDALISLTAPKLGSLTLPASTMHYVGGRFVPDTLAAELGFQLPQFEGSAQITRVKNG